MLATREIYLKFIRQSIKTRVVHFFIIDHFVSTWWRMKIENIKFNNHSLSPCFPLAFRVYLLRLFFSECAIARYRQQLHNNMTLFNVTLNRLLQ